MKNLIPILLFGLVSCNPKGESLEDTLTPPVIIITMNDSGIIVQGAEGKEYLLNTHDRVNYRAAFLNVGDTLKFQ